MVSPDERKRPADPLIGALVNGKFRIERAIARGGMGRIYYGTQAPLDRPVALKVVKADTVNEEDSQFLKRFLLEASILAKLQHPNIVTLFDYGRIENSPNDQEMYFIAMEYLNGETLSDRLRDVGALTAYETLLLFRQIARGLREAHARGVIHRDLKPSNIIIVPEADGEIVKLVDFGIGKVSTEGADLTRDGILVGTPKYMAPEQFDGSASPASDVYALGTIIFQLLTGEAPFSGGNMAEFMMAKLQQPIPSMREINPICDSTELLESLVYAMLARRQDERPSLEEVFEHLARCEEEVFGASGVARLAGASGSRPILGNPVSSRSITARGQQSVGALKVPYTIVAPQPLVAGGSTQSGIATLQGLTGMTPRPMSTSAAPMAPAKRTFPLPAVLALVFAVVSIGGTAIYLVHAKRAASEGANPPPSASVVAATTGSATPDDSFVLHLDTTPTGAVVSEDNVVLGTTPLDVRLDRATVRSSPRTFQIKKDGYAPTMFAQGVGEGRVEQVVALAPEAAHAVKSTRGAGRNGGGRTSPAGGDSDIRLKR